MGARTSAEMREAQRHLWLGASGYQAAKLAGVRESSISRSGLCREIIATVSLAKAMIKNSPESSDAQLLEYFTNELGIPEVHARHHVERREEIRKAPPARGRKRIAREIP